MPTPTRALTNDHKDCKLVKLDANDPTSPCIIMQEGYAPGDTSSQMKMFYLQHDGFWVDEIARSTMPDSTLSEVIYDKPADAVKALSNIFGRPLVRPVSTTESDTKSYIARMQSIGSPEAGLRDVLRRYRAAQGPRS